MKISFMTRNDIYRILGIAVKNYRLKNGWSQEELAERAGLHPSYIGQIERGTKKISLVTLQKISLALKIKISDLLDEKEPVYRKSSWEDKILGMVKDRQTFPPYPPCPMRVRTGKQALSPF